MGLDKNKLRIIEYQIEEIAESFAKATTRIAALVRQEQLRELVMEYRKLVNIKPKVKMMEPK